MELLDIAKEIINSLGFPILMVFYFIWDKKQSMDALIESLNNNTAVMLRICSKLGIATETESEEPVDE